MVSNELLLPKAIDDVTDEDVTFLLNACDTPLAAFLAGARTLRLADGPDEVHMYQLGRDTVKKYMMKE